MAKKMTNPRFPHRCRIYRLQGATSFNPEGEPEVVYEGECRKSSSDNIRTFNTGQLNTGKVDTTDYRVSMPGIVKGIRKGDLIDVETAVSREEGMRIVNFDSTSLGEYAVPDGQSLFGSVPTLQRGRIGSTAVLCNLPSN